MKTSNIRTDGRFDFPVEGTFLGYDNNAEYYYRDGSIITLNSFSLVIALTELIGNTFYEYARRHAWWVDCNFSDWTDRNSKVFEHFNSFANAYVDAFLLLSAFHIALGDQLIHPLTPDALDKVFDSNDIDFDAFNLSKDKITYIKEAILSYAFNGCFNYSNFSIEGLKALLDNDSIIFAPGFDFVIRHLAREYDNLIRKLRILTTSLPVLIKETLERNDREPILRYTDWLKCGLSSPSISLTPNVIRIDELPPIFSEHYDNLSAISDLYSETHMPCLSFNRIIIDKKADPYDSSHGYRLLSFYDSRDLLNTVYSEYEHMCMNNMELVKCKNCGRFFRPISRASNFCDRPIEDGSGRTCKSISSQWYVDQRKGENPAYDEYVLYRKRYRSRITRNSTKNPYSRYDDWNIRAHTLLDSYNRGEITLESFSKTLKEMDEDMKPLDKM